MSTITSKKRRKKGKYARNRVSRKVLSRSRIRRKIFKSRSWKLNYPEHFTVIEKYPYIIKKKSD